MAELNGLDDVAWDKLHHAYGPAVDFPATIRTLNDPESTKTKVADCMRQLWGNIFHQGTVWQATAATVPFFVDMLVNGPENSELKVFIITYLHHLATGYPPDRFGKEQQLLQKFESVQGREDPGTKPNYKDRELFVIWMRDTYVSVEETALDIVTGYLNDPEPKIAEAAIFFVSSFPRKAHITLPLLAEIISNQQLKPMRRALAGLSYCNLLHQGDPTDLLSSTLNELVESNESRHAARIMCAALAIANPEEDTPYENLLDYTSDEAASEVIHTYHLENLILLVQKAREVARK